MAPLSAAGLALARRASRPSTCRVVCQQGPARQAPRRPDQDAPPRSGGGSRGHRPGRTQPAAVPSNTPAEPQRLQKVMAAAGVAARRACEDLIAAGKVTVNGELVTALGVKVDPARDVISVEGRRLSLAAPAQQRHIYLALHKPKGYVCSAVSERPGQRALDLVDPFLQQWGRRIRNKGQPAPRLFTVGRLDVASSGLLLITSDGVWANRVSHPSGGLTKEYVVSLAARPTAAQLAALAAGTMVEEALVVPVAVQEMTRTASVDKHRVCIVVREGRKHEVRILVADAGMQLTSLKRTRIGGLRLPTSLKRGGYVELKADQVAAVLQEPGME